MTVRDILASFPDAKRDGAGWAAKCPAHDDHRASLSIGRGDDGRWLVHCHVGCSLEAILAAVHLETKDLFPEKTTTTTAKKVIVETYDYTDEAGRLISQAVRYEPKNFRQRRPDGAGGWTWNLQGVRRVLFRLPQLKGREAVVICEGEKDVQTAEAWGFPATCNAGGASTSLDKSKWLPDYSQQLVAAGVKRVVLVPDNDAAGRAHMAAVARSCHAAGLQVRLVTLPDVPDKGDLSDYAAVHNREDFIALAKAAPVYTPPALTMPATIEDPDEPATPTTRAVVTPLSAIAPQTVDYLWPGRCARGRLNLRIGDPGLGKSFVELDAAARISRGASWPDGGLAPLGDVLILSAEDNAADTIRPRAEAMGADLDRIHILSAVRVGDDERYFSLVSDLSALDAAIVDTGASLVIVDPLSAYFGMDVDSYKDTHVRSVLGPLAQLAERRNVAIDGVMHLSKGADRKVLYRALGSIGFVAAARLVLAVAEHPDDDTKRVLVHVKNNLCVAAPTLAFRLDDGRVVWDDEPATDVTADSVLGGALDQRERRDAESFLRDLLESGEQGVTQVQQAARQAGLAWRSIERAKGRLRVEAVKVGFGEAGRWYWSLPKTATVVPFRPKTATVEDLAVLGESPAKTPDFTGLPLKTATFPEVAVLGPDRAEVAALSDPDEVPPDGRF